MMFSSSIFSFVCRGFMSYLCYLYLFAYSVKKTVVSNMISISYDVCAI